MYPTTLKQLLADPSLSPATITQAEQLSRQWFEADPMLASFVVWSVFTHLITRDLADEQAVPTTEWDRFLADVLPPLLTLLNALPTPTTAQIDSVVLGYHSSL